MNGYGPGFIICITIAKQAEGPKMREDNKRYVQLLLEEYRTKIRKIAQMRYELEHPALVSPAEIIEAMTFTKRAGEGARPVGCISDKTLYIAMNYQETAANLNNESQGEIVSMLIPLEREIDRLEHYVALLDAQEAAVIRRHYFKGCSWDQLSEEIHTTSRTLRRIKNSAINTLAEMYDLVINHDRRLSADCPLCAANGALCCIVRCTNIRLSNWKGRPLVLATEDVLDFAVLGIDR